MCDGWARILGAGQIRHSSGKVKLTSQRNYDTISAEVDAGVGKEGSVGEDWAQTLRVCSGQATFVFFVSSGSVFQFVTSLLPHFALLWTDVSNIKQLHCPQISCCRLNRIPCWEQDSYYLLRTSVCFGTIWYKLNISGASSRQNTPE